MPKLFWTEFLSDQDLDLHASGEEKPKSSWTHHTWGRIEGEELRPAAGSVIMNHEMGTATVYENGVATETSTLSPDDAVRRYLERDIVPPDSPDGHRMLIAW